jgi:fructoselysine-6-phosphate deglycase
MVESLFPLDADALAESHRRALDALPQVDELAATLLERSPDVLFLSGCGGTMARLQAVHEALAQRLPFPVVLRHAAELAATPPDALNERATLLVGSKSGDTAEVLDLLEVAARRGTHRIGFVGVRGSRVAEGLDLAVFNDDEDISPLLLAALVARLAELSKGGEGLESVRADVMRMPESFAALASAQDEWARETAAVVGRAPFSMWTGSGPLWGHVESLSMFMLEEMQWRRAQPVHAANFFHGPLELVDDDLALFVTLSNGGTRALDERVARFLDRVPSGSARVIDVEQWRPEGLSDAGMGLLQAELFMTVMRRVVTHMQGVTGRYSMFRRYYRRFDY